MSILFECSDCGRSLKVKDDYAGRKIKCPDCDSVIRVPEDESQSDDEDDDDSSRRSRSSSKSSRTGASRRESSRTGSSRSETSHRSQSRRSRPDDDDDDETPRSPKRKKGTKKSKSDSDGGIPVWAIVTGSSLVGVLAIGAVAFIAMKPKAAQAEKEEVAAGAKAKPPVAGGAKAVAANVVQAQADGNGARFRMKWEMPLKWTSEGGIEDNMWPWAKMKGQGQTIRLSSNRSFTENASTMTSMGGFTERLKTAHTVRTGKLQAENNDWVEGTLNIHKGKRGPVIWSDYEYKGMIGKGYGIRCTIVGPKMPCTLMMECAQTARDQWRPMLLKIAESVHFVSLKKNGEEGDDDFDDGPAVEDKPRRKRDAGEKPDAAADKEVMDEDDAPGDE